MSGLNRSMRRQRERSLGYKNAVKAQCDRVLNRLQDQQITADTNNLVSAMYYLIGIVLHEEYKFGQDRIMRVYKGIDDRLITWQKGDGAEETMNFRHILEKEVGIILPMHW